MYEELIKSLRICGAPISRKDCPHYAEQDPHCFIRLKIEAADAIEELEAQLSAARKTLAWLAEPYEAEVKDK